MLTRVRVVATFWVYVLSRFAIASVDGLEERVGEGSIVVCGVDLSSGDVRLRSSLVFFALVATLGGFA